MKSDADSGGLVCGKVERDANTVVHEGRFQSFKLSKSIGEELKMGDFGRLMIVIGAILVVVGIVMVVLGKTHFPLGRLPGDFVYRGKNTTVYFPLATSILLSVILTVVMYLVGRWRR